MDACLSARWPAMTCALQVCLACVNALYSVAVAFIQGVILTILTSQVKQ